MRYSWICPKVIDGNGKTISGCGYGNWGDSFPGKCPTCKGDLRITQEIKTIDLRK